MKTTRNATLVDALLADEPAPEYVDQLGLYGQFIGDWLAKVVTHSAGGGRHEGRCEIRFDWILEGRAIQDVWMIPSLRERRSGVAAPSLPVSGNWCGTTIRAYDGRISAWRIFWIDPATNAYGQQIGRRVGKDIVQEGRTDAGHLSRWSFTKITPSSFHWTAEGSTDEGATWTLFVDVFAERVQD